MLTDTRPILLYLAGPIDGIALEEARGWRLELEPPLGVMFFSPAHAYFGAEQFTFPRADHVNRHAIVCADGVLANLLGPGRGYNTIREIEFAKSHGKPVAIAGDLTGSMTPDVAVLASLEDALTELLSMIKEGRDRPSGIALLLPGFLGMPGEDDDD